VLIGGNSEFIEESMMPDTFHIIPIVDNTVINWIFKVEDTSLGLSFITNVGIFVVHTAHDTL
jgi:hypothetical protein